MSKINIKVNIKRLPKSEVEIEGELDADVFEGYWNTALKRIGENVELDGFRKGKVPENILLSKIPESKILEEMAELALGEYYPQILEENKIDAISRPEISITKLARKNPLGFKIKTAVLPEITMPDYKDIAKKIVIEQKKTNENIEVTDKELEDTITDIRKSRAPKIKMADLPTEAEAEKGGAKEHIHKDGEEHDHSHEEEKTEVPQELPELNDEFVQALGPFKDVADFKDKLKENIKLEKINQAREKTRLLIVEKILEDMKVDLPEVLIEAEVSKIIYRMESDITAMGLKFEDYLGHIKKTKEDLKKEFRNDGEKKAKLSLALNEIAKNEKIEADKEQVAKEVAMILEHYKDADPERAQMHAENVLINERVFEFLEGQK